MYDARHFRPSLYLVLFMGLSGFSMATDTPGLWVLTMALAGLNTWLVFTDRFHPLPRWLAGILSVLALAWALLEIRYNPGPQRMILVYIGEFLILTQLIKLYEQRANRDYAQLLVISLLLMVAASIMTTSLLFGILFAIYLIFAFYSCLLLHLKVETDNARAALVIPESRLSPLTLRQDQRFLLRSMRRITVLVTLFATVCGVTVFIFFPRGPAGGLFGQLQFKPDTALTGFSDHVSFDQINQIRQNDEVAAHVKVWRDGRLVRGTRTLYLRGLTVDAYGIDPRRPVRRPQWSRSKTREIPDENVELFDPEEQARRPGTEQWHQKVMLYPTGSRYLFALPGVIAYPRENLWYLAMKTTRHVPVRYAPVDGAIQTEPVMQQLDYDVYSTNQPMPTSVPLGQLVQQMRRQPVSDPKVLAQVREYAIDHKLIPDISKAGAKPIPEEDFEKIARRIEMHLRTQFSYTLDLTPYKSEFVGIDPVVAFLTRVKKGHCEYFASAMTLMCQSAGIPARMVLGFRTDGDSYNPIGDYYIVKQAYAHSWVEVATPHGWVTYDPTSGREATAGSKASTWGAIKHFMDYLENLWAEHVVAYDTKDRDNLLKDLDTKAMNMLYQLTSVGKFFHDLRDMKFLESAGFWQFALRGIMFLMVFMMLVIVGLVIQYLYARRLLKQRAARIGLDHLPEALQLQLARQLVFYDELTRQLEECGIRRPEQLTPREWAESLVYLPLQAYESIRRLTEMLYRVRFGRVVLTAARQRHLMSSVARLAEQLPRSKRAPRGGRGPEAPGAR